MSDSEGEERSTFAVPKFKGKYVEFEPQLLAFAMLKVCAIAFEPNQTSDYFPTGQKVFSEDEVKRTKQKSFVKRNLQGMVALNTADPTILGNKVCFQLRGLQRELRR